MDAHYMERALEQARQSENPYPNPRVGAVVVADGAVVGDGMHRGPGTAHAERVALDDAGDAAAGSTLYVTLEPCTHHGRTPPCTDAIIESGVERVVAAMADPRPDAGGGLALLDDNGIETQVGVLEEDAAAMNAFLGYFTDRPYTAIKTAMTLDGKIASRSGESGWISGEASRDRVHELRDVYDAILVGAGTVLSDDPRLTARPAEGQGDDPLRVVLDRNLDTPLDATLVTDGGATVIYAAADAVERDRETVNALPDTVEVVPFEDGLDELFTALDERGVSSLLVEGGGAANWAFLEAGAVDRLYVFVAPKLLGGRDATTLVDGAGFDLGEELQVEIADVERVGDDLLIHAEPRRRSP